MTRLQYFFSNDDSPAPTRSQRLVAASCACFILLSFAVALVLSFYQSCSVAATGYGAAQGVLSSVIYVVMQMPQILVTWRTRASASLSLITVFLNASGGVLAAYVQVVASHERWSTYLPNVVRPPPPPTSRPSNPLSFDAGLHSSKHFTVRHGGNIRFEITCAEAKGFSCGGARG